MELLVESVSIYIRGMFVLMRGIVVIENLHGVVMRMEVYLIMIVMATSLKGHRRILMRIANLSCTTNYNGGGSWSISCVDKQTGVKCVGGNIKDNLTNKVYFEWSCLDGGVNYGDSPDFSLKNGAPDFFTQ